MFMNSFVIAIDIGSPKCTKKNPNGKLGWFDSKGNSGYAKDFLQQIENRDYYAIGIEAPLFIPVASLADFTASRSFDGNRPWSAGPGACVTAINLPFLLLCIRTIKNKDVEVTTDYDYWKTKQSHCVLFWEAFISGKDDGMVKEKLISENIHLQDAELVCKKFMKAENMNIITLAKESFINLPQVFALSEGIRVSHTEKGLIVKSAKQQ